LLKETKSSGPRYRVQIHILDSYKSTLGDSNAVMGFDDPVVIILIVAVVVFLFGAGQIPKFARSIGQARKEFDNALHGTGSSATVTNATMTPVTAAATTAQADPLILAAQKEGIDTTGKTKGTNSIRTIVQVKQGVGDEKL
jgi:TatA/E family protein of Tat protein translocase